jgi:hypothetical protein
MQCVGSAVDINDCHVKALHDDRVDKTGRIVDLKADLKVGFASVKFGDCLGCDLVKKHGGDPDLYFAVSAVSYRVSGFSQFVGSREHALDCVSKSPTVNRRGKASSAADKEWEADRFFEFLN